MPSKSRFIVAPFLILLVAAAVSTPLHARALADIVLPLDAQAVFAMAAVAASAIEPCAFTVKTFCAAHGISVPTYYKLRNQGLGPAEMRFGPIIRISREAAERWRRERETMTEDDQRAAEALRDRARRAAKRAVASPSHVSNRGG